MIEEEEKFSRIKFKVHKLPLDADLEKEFPMLFTYPEVQEYEHDKKNLLLRYICLLYDPETDLIDEFSNDYNQRRIAAAIEAGIERKKDKWPKWFELAMKFKKLKPRSVKDGKDEETGDIKYKTVYDEVVDEGLIMMILGFIKIFKNRIWTEICTLEVELDRLTKQRWEGLGVEDPQTAIKSGELSRICENHIAKLNSYLSEFLTGDKELEESLEMITPENKERLMSA